MTKQKSPATSGQSQPPRIPQSAKAARKPIDDLADSTALQATAVGLGAAAIGAGVTTAATYYADLPEGNQTADAQQSSAQSAAEIAQEASGHATPEAIVEAETYYDSESRSHDGSENTDDTRGDGGKTRDGHITDPIPNPGPDHDIAEVEIDPEDLDGSQLFDFDSVQTIYDEEGNEIVMAGATLPDGTQIAVADIDGDEVFDQVYDPASGQMVSDDPTLIAGITVGDAEIAGDTQQAYIPPTIDQDDPLPTGDEFMGDIIDA